MKTIVKDILLYAWSREGLGAKLRCLGKGIFFPIPVGFSTGCKGKICHHPIEWCAG